MGRFGIFGYLSDGLAALLRIGFRSCPLAARGSAEGLWPGRPSHSRPASRCAPGFAAANRSRWSRLCPVLAPPSGVAVIPCRLSGAGR